jgi:hypothetical protein
VEIILLRNNQLLLEQRDSLLNAKKGGCVAKISLMQTANGRRQKYADFGNLTGCGLRLPLAICPLPHVLSVFSVNHL